MQTAAFFIIFSHGLRNDMKKRTVKPSKQALDKEDEIDKLSAKTLSLTPHSGLIDIILEYTKRHEACLERDWDQRGQDALLWGEESLKKARYAAIKGGIHAAQIVADLRTEWVEAIEKFTAKGSSVEDKCIASRKERTLIVCMWMNNSLYANRNLYRKTVRIMEKELDANRLSLSIYWQNIQKRHRVIREFEAFAERPDIALDAFSKSWIDSAKRELETMLGREVA